MSCYKYKPWITDAAAESLRPHHDAELRAHVAHCEDCRLALERARELMATIDRGIVDVLDVEPSEELHASIRRRFGRRDVRTQALCFAPTARWAATAAVAVFMAAAGITIWKARPTSTEKTVLVSPAPAMRQRLSQRLSSAPTAARRPKHKGAVMARNEFGMPPVRRSRRGLHRSKEPAQPQVLVEKDQEALLIELYKGLMTGRIKGQPLLKTPPGYKRGPDGWLVPAPLQIPPIRIARLNFAHKAAGSSSGTL